MSNRHVITSVKYGNTYNMSPETHGGWVVRNANNTTWVGNIRKTSPTQYTFENANGADFGFAAGRRAQPIDVLNQMLTIRQSIKLNTHGHRDSRKNKHRTKH